MTNTLSMPCGKEFAGINLACGGKLCSEAGWINADHSSGLKNVIKVNLLNPLPFSNNTFDVVYHSQFIEHLTGDKALAFMKECHRILKPNGVLRVVTPDLQNQAIEYLRNLQALLDDPYNEGAQLRYEWIRLEMLDQLTRHSSGGEMMSFLKLSGKNVFDYLWERMGRSGENLIPESENSKNARSWKDLLRKIKGGMIACSTKFSSEAKQVGKFRLSGESHLCMYDEYLLNALFAQSGFKNITKVSALESRIPSWELTRLDCDSQGYPDGQVSLFMEAVKIM
jgi:predicted SAM-dependent methyltransferase